MEARLCKAWFSGEERGFPCVRREGHGGDHESVLGDTWRNDAAVRPFRFTVTVDVAAADEEGYRAEHGLDETDETRGALAATVADELTALGEENGWWHRVHVR
ncbi:hypothetical protein [Nocardiopsis halophila]|uniref:hypothetical protein n=1 Tax=Nocardiopsis halophila TaxID=141692 RepID=UPI000346B206|nr:hypothetical protein [Nocardiopsis halophila]